MGDRLWFAATSMEQLDARVLWRPQVDLAKDRSDSCARHWFVIDASSEHDRVLDE